jgi:hypothetical protein
MTIEAMSPDEATDTLFRTMYRHVDARFEALKDAGLKLAHYTSAENALKIIDGESIWLRNAALMNDFMEISFGATCIVPALQELLPEAIPAVDAVHPGLLNDCITRMANVEQVVNNHTYLTSLAEYEPENRLGKLSMWRAYGGPTAGVALVFNLDVFENGNPDLGATLRPVLYGADELVPVLTNMITALRDNTELLAKVPRERAQSIVFHALQDLVLTTKHEGFREEEEWRVIYSPQFSPSAFLRETPVAVGGIPQVIFPITLRDQPGLNMPDINLDQLIHRVIIGPCQYPEQVGHAFHEAMRLKDMTDPRGRMQFSSIPLRQRG